MTSTVRRAFAFALVGTLALLVPVVTRADSTVVDTVRTATGLPAVLIAAIASVAPFGLIAAAALSVDEGGRTFELFARAGDREDGKLYGLASFALAIGGLALLSVAFGFPTWAFVGAVFALAYGNLVYAVLDSVADEPVVATAGFVAGGFAAAAIGQAVAVTAFGDAVTPEFGALVVFLSASAALLGALLRAVLFERDDPLVLLSIGLLLWLFTDLPLQVTATRVAIALAVTVLLGYVAYALDTASLPGMLTGIFLGLLTIVLGGVGWFAMLITFFGLGGLASKFRYEEKAERGIAEENEGARGSGNVLANSLVGLLAVLAFAASHGQASVEPALFLFAFAGSIAAAMSDTFSSEFGGLYDRPRLITTLEPVDPGTDGGVTWQGAVAGLAGAAIIAAIGLGLFPDVGPKGAGVVLAAGFAGMAVDSLLGATIEGEAVGNQGVNFLATLSAALVAAALALAVGVV